MTRRTRQWGIALRVTGSLLKPGFQPDTDAVVRSGAAVLLGAPALPAAIIPLIETGAGKDSDCGAPIGLVGKRASPVPVASGGP